MKLGGSSLANTSRIKKAAKIVQRFSRENTIVVVVSALDDVTDKLAEIGEIAQKGDRIKAARLVSGMQILHHKTAQKLSPKGRRETVTKIDEIDRELERTVQGASHL